MKKRISDYSFALLERDGLSSILQEWHPTPENESSERLEGLYEKQLAEWLSKRIPHVPFHTQYGVAKGRGDIVVQDEYLIELKLGFSADRPAEFDRCIGQLYRYHKKWLKEDEKMVYLLLVGPSHADYREMLQEWIDEHNSKFVFTHYYLIEVSFA